MKAESANFESRSHPRFPVALPIDYWPVDSLESHIGRTANVSENGLLIYVPEPLKIGKNVRLKVFFTLHSDINFIEALVEVVWKDFDLGKDGEYRIGTKYVGISPEDQNRFKSFLNNLKDTRVPPNEGRNN